MQPSPTPSNQKWFILLAIGIGTFMSALDGSVVNTILPVITKEFGGGGSTSSHGKVLVAQPFQAVHDSYRVAIKQQFTVAAGFSLRLHRRDACATD